MTNILQKYALKLIVGHEIRDITVKVDTHRNIVSLTKQEMPKIKQQALIRKYENAC